MSTQPGPSPKQQLAMSAMMSLPFLAFLGWAAYFNATSKHDHEAMIAGTPSDSNVAVAAILIGIPLVLHIIPLTVAAWVYRAHRNWDKRAAKIRGFIVALGPLGLIAVAFIGWAIYTVVTPSRGHNDWGGVALVFMGPVVAAILCVLLGINISVTIAKQRAIERSAPPPLPAPGDESSD